MPCSAYNRSAPESPFPRKAGSCEKSQLFPSLLFGTISAIFLKKSQNFCRAIVKIDRMGTLGAILSFLIITTRPSSAPMTLKFKGREKSIEIFSEAI